jgi:hypothetical protein
LTPNYVCYKVSLECSILLIISWRHGMNILRSSC